MSLIVGKRNKECFILEDNLSYNNLSCYKTIVLIFLISSYKLILIIGFLL